MANEQFKKPRGTLDYFYNDEEVLLGLKDVLMDEAGLYGCSPCEPPMFEENKLFHRTDGESSDIVTKQTFDLANKGEKDYTLRPEYTASVNRAVVENKYFALPDMPLRLSYFGPVFRYERPQAGRLREFSQYGVEFIDSKVDIDTSVEALLLSVNAAKLALGHDVLVKLNFLGSFKSRENYKKELYNYFKPQIGNMCEDCQRRLETNPLRILDCKVPEDQAIGAKAPKISDFLDEEDKKEYDTLLKAITSVGVKYEVDDRLVRGLDYYTGLVWEIYDDKKVEVGAIGGGGKYANLMEEIGGPSYEGIGFSLGIERILLCLDDKRKDELAKKENTDVFIIDNRRDGKALYLADKLRQNGLAVTFSSFTRGMGGAFKMADRKKTKYVLIVDEKVLQLKNMVTREQKEVSEEEVLGLKKEAQNA
ncbi:MAG: histidine--tRNA ligase [Bacilli bacterium]|jgi:histidyl-tRNA synthetase